MALTIKHTKVSAIPDGSDPSLVLPSDWNADHSLTGVASLAQGGTNATDAATARTNLGLGSVATENIVPVAKGGTGVATLIGIVKGNGTGNMTAATGADIAAAIGTTVITNASYANSAGDITGGVANQILYQNGVASTHYIDAPTTASTFLQWNGTSFAWAAAGGGSLLGQTQSVSPFETSLGFEAGNANTGANNTYLGYQAGKAHTGATNNVIIGYQAMDVATIPSSNVIIGASACGASSNTSQNVVIGFNAAGTTTALGSDSVIIGNDAGRTVTGTSNVLIGSSCGNNVTTGSQMIGIGLGCFGAATAAAAGAVAVGNNALGSLTTGAGNSAIGYNSANLLTTGGNNTCLGYETGKAMVTSALNTFIGYRAGILTTGGTNTVVGANVNPVLSTGAGNTFIGVGAGNNVSTGSNNTVIGNGPLPAADSSNYVALYDGVGDLAVMFNDPGAMTFDGTNYGEIGQVLTSQSTTNRPIWSWNNQSNTYVGGGFGVTMTENYSLYLMSPSVATVTMTLPTPSVTNRGLTFTVKRTDGVGTNVLNLTTPTGQIDGATTYVIPLRGAITVASTGTNWAILSTYTEPVALQAPIIQSTMGGDSDAFITFTPVEGATGYDVLVDPNGN